MCNLCRYRAVGFDQNYSLCSGNFLHMEFENRLQYENTFLIGHDYTLHTDERNFFFKIEQSQFYIRGVRAHLGYYEPAMECDQCVW